MISYRIQGRASGCLSVSLSSALLWMELGGLEKGLGGPESRFRGIEREVGEPEMVLE